MKYKVYTKYKKILADMHTPVAIYNQFRDQYANALLLESADYHDRTDSKSFICLDPISNFEAKGNQYHFNFPEEETQYETVTHPKFVFQAFQHYANSFISTKTDLPFNVQGLWGYSSFESVQYMEDITLNKSIDDLKDNPDLKYQLFRYLLVFDHFKNELFIVHNEINEPIKDDRKINELSQILQRNSSHTFQFESLNLEQSPITDEQFKEMVTTAIKHCKQGDTFQVVLSREFRQEYKGDDFNVYRALRSINPSPYLFYFDYGNFRLFGSSPESQLQVHNNIAEINPIAGTVLRTNDKEIDEQLARELKENPKEMSEHVMLVDLARNDLSKHSQSIEISRYAEIQYFSHVIHMVSKVNGILDNDTDCLTTYKDTFPAGTLTGAPKYRALEIIGDNEENSRNFYGGSVGFIGFNNSVNHAIIIRSVLSKNNTLVYQAGAGIVSDSTPNGENQEVFNKIMAIRQAIKNANKL